MLKNPQESINRKIRTRKIETENKHKMAGVRNKY